jgi:hypothetical protein
MPCVNFLEFSWFFAARLTAIVQSRLAREMSISSRSVDRLTDRDLRAQSII